jgi:squalene synthase HpnC
LTPPGPGARGRAKNDAPVVSGEPGVDSATLRQKERAENFPVVLTVLPRRYGVHLRALYDVARVIDDLGDAAAGDRTEQLRELRADLALIWQGRRPSAPVLQRLARTVRVCDLDAEPFDRLVAANLQDQAVNRYETYDDLRRYCTLSADPVGRVVLEIFGASTARRVELSDRVCTALQLVEHWQDIAEDRRAGRIYLPMRDMAAYGVAEKDLDRPAATPALRQLIGFEIGRAAKLLDSGTPLVGSLNGWARIAVAGYVAGGRAAIAAIRRAGYDVLQGPPRPRRRDVLAELLRLLAGTRRWRVPGGSSPRQTRRPPHGGTR